VLGLGLVEVADGALERVLVRLRGHCRPSASAAAWTLPCIASFWSFAFSFWRFWRHVIATAIVLLVGLDVDVLLQLVDRLR
jgi:hypothetical protein